MLHKAGIGDMCPTWDGECHCEDGQRRVEEVLGCIRVAPSPPAVEETCARPEEVPTMPGTLDEWFCVWEDCDVQIIGSPAYVERRAAEHMAVRHPGSAGGVRYEPPRRTTRRALPPCVVPPRPGWRCTRGFHADGPCAAVPLGKPPAWTHAWVGLALLGAAGVVCVVFPEITPEQAGAVLMPGAALIAVTIYLQHKWGRR